jgi:hypothetical protein
VKFKKVSVTEDKEGSIRLKETKETWELHGMPDYDFMKRKIQCGWDVSSSSHDYRFNATELKSQQTALWIMTSRLKSLKQAHELNKFSKGEVQMTSI